MFRIVKLILPLVALAACADSSGPSGSGKVRVIASARPVNTPTGRECRVEWTARIRPAGAAVTYTVRTYAGSFTDSVMETWSIAGQPDYASVNWHVQRDSTLDRTEGWSIACWAASGGSSTFWGEP